MGLFKRGDVWWFRYTMPKGQRRRVSTDCRDEASAIAWEAAFRAKLAATKRETVLPRTPWDRLIEMYLNSARALAHVDRYQKQRRVCLVEISQRWPDPHSVSPRMVRAWMDELCRTVGGKTAANKLRFLSALYRWAVANDYVARNPCLGAADAIPPAAEVPGRRTLTMEEILRLSATEEPRGIVYLWMGLTGLRRSETRAAAWGWISSDKVTVPACASKSKTEQSVPLARLLIPKLHSHREWLAGNGLPVDDQSLIFPSFRIGSRDVGGVPRSQKFRSDLERAGIPPEDRMGRKMLIHGLRHSLGTNLAASGASAAEIQSLMRHADIRTSIGYIDKSRLIGRDALGRMTGEQ